MSLFDDYAIKLPPKEVVDKRVLCLFCKELFTPTKEWQKFCKPQCRANYWVAKQKDKESVFCDMTDDSQPIEVKDDPKKPTIDVFASFQAGKPPSHDAP